MAGASAFTEQQSDRAIRRLAKLLAWTPPELVEAASTDPGRTAWTLGASYSPLYLLEDQGTGFAFYVVAR